jgi:tRNA A37 N6-isopentenylltransferase MiaA
MLTSGQPDRPPDRDHTSFPPKNKTSPIDSMRVMRILEVSRLTGIGFQYRK